MGINNVEAKAVPRAVLDSNVYIAAYLTKNPRSPNKEIFRHWRDSRFTLLVSKSILTEVVEKFDKYGIAQQLTFDLLAHILTYAVHINVPEKSVKAIIPADRDDDLILACAVVGRADYLVTYDPHFDVLGGEYEGIKIVDGLHFLYVVRGDAKPGGIDSVEGKSIQ